MTEDELVARGMKIVNRLMVKHAPLEVVAANMGIRELAAVIARQQDQIERMREVFDLLDWKGERVGIQAPEDAAVGRLCEQWGYGAVMDSAARQWRRKDPDGAFLVGTCAVIVRGVLK